MVNPYLAECTVIVFPFTQQPDGDEIIIANASNTAFLSLPSSAVDILTWLAQGKTVGEAQTLYAQVYSEVPDIEDFLTLLENEGFVLPAVAVSLDINAPQPSQPIATREVSHANVTRYHFESIPQDVARRIFSRPILLSCLFLVILALAFIVLDPSVIPPPQIVVFKQNLTLMSLGLYLFLFITIFLHEMAHLVAARAAGVPARLSISHRLWFLVVQTDISSIWMASKWQRYLAVLAGSLLDAVASSLLIVLIFAQYHGWIPISTTVLLFCRIALFTYLLRLLWECYFFVRTDFYYVVTILFNCKNLMGDTETFLLNLCARFFSFIRCVDQSSIPRREMRVVRLYALAYLGGRVVAFVSLIMIMIPILTGYAREIWIFLSRGQFPASFALADIIGWIVVVGIPIILQTLGFVLWVHSLFFARRSKNGTLTQ